MEQHPIPQQISSYQFKLVGDMTLKQFFQVAGGVIISLIFYSTPLNPIIKWFFILFSTGLGAALAFLPFEERPLERWIFAFFRSIYSPTLFSWQKTEKPPVFYTETATVPAVQNIPAELNLNTNDKKLEEAEKSFLNKVGGMWNVTNTSQTTVNTVQNTAVPQPSSIPTLQPNPNTVIKPVVNTVLPPVAIPSQIPTVITRTAPKLVVEESSTAPNIPVTSNLVMNKVTEKPITTNAVEFSVDAAPPSPPIVVNTVVGQVMDENRKIIEGAILEIKDSGGRPVRALKSNKAGHFIIVTQLANGKYEITTEKDGFTFKPVSFETKGEMIPPIAIKGTKI